VTKVEIRRLMRARRAALAPAARDAASAALCARLLARPEVKAACARQGCVAVYLAMPQELDLTPFIVKLLAAGVRLVAPRWNGTAYDLAPLAGLEAGVLRAGPMGVREPVSAEIVAPADVDVWIVPGMAFTADGTRLGYGGGWYDRFLAQARSDARSLGVAYSFQCLAALPCEIHDIRLTSLVTVEPISAKLSV